ncbi:MAG TPA: MBL fold metallo-hydrolase [Candidatus Bathyarchaeia archaeon]|nr:MBL fold metallo-hydrolase [Candidatus Bathyarchaeia archaeon]
MRLQTVLAEGLAHQSYYLSDHDEAMVIDPRRDCAIYTKMAASECAKITYIFETHCHEDFVTGSLALQNQTGAEVGHSKETRFQYGDHALADGDRFAVGDLRIDVLSTPGHTKDSVSFVVYEKRESEVPLVVFTGDTLLAGDVGRTDLLGSDSTRAQAKKLHSSIFATLLPLGDQPGVYPAHGPGSLCGNKMRVRAHSTMGYERQLNPLLQLDEDEFVSRLSTQQLSLPPYFRRAQRLNVQGPPPAPQRLREIDSDEFQGLASDAATVIDTREAGAFAGSHIPGSLSIWLDGLSVYPGWILPDEARVALVTERPVDAVLAQTYLHRLGFDTVTAHLCNGIREWRNRGKPIARIKTCSVDELKKAVDRAACSVLDVREEDEWREGHIKGAQHVFVGHLPQQITKVPRDLPLAVHCSWGGRASLAASILARHGFTRVYNVLGAMRAWKSRGYPLERG